MKVLHVLDTDGFAGTESHVLTLMNAIAPLGVQAELACRRESPLEAAARAAGCETHSIFNGVEIIDLLAAVQRQIKQDRPDVLHAHNGRTMLATAIAGGKAGLPVVGTQHFIDPQFTRYLWLKRLVALRVHRWVNLRLAHVIAVSESARRAMISREGLSPERITTVHNGIECPAVSAIRGDIDAIGCGGAIVMTVARLSREKGLVHLLRAVPIVLESHPATRFVFVGEGPDAAQLIAEAEDLGVTKAVNFIGFRANAADLIAACDVFVLPSETEPFGLVLLEAMARSRPVVACRAGGPGEIVDHGRTGRLVPPADPAALASAIKDLLSNPAERERLGACGRDRFESHFTAQRMAVDTLKVYERVCAS